MKQLEKISKKILKMYSKYQTLSMFDIANQSKFKAVELADPFIELIDKKLICKMMDINDLLNDKFDPEAQYYITQAGRSYLDSLKTENFKFYFQIAIQLLTTIIAVAAFIKSFFVNS